ncbi:helix-turn-helix domain-containing protein [Agrococcus sp. SL85]|uniref:helix-turn-helix domain-containing protein n=1 Tax=Agrococcus sp. SL85 TaxID=2995141 RepID=UPI00226CA008|nr:helix-turn-helix domain-containing protein [Agrococcus sp. SL85]WAC65754.1 helix-turn-helix domain-containing protein [Agrococcus sp. SL85]
MATRLLTVSEVAARLNRSVQAIRWQMHKGELKFGTVAGRRVMRESDLEAYIDAAFETEAAS